MKLFFRRAQPIIIDPFRLWRSYQAIGKDVPIVPLGGFEDEDGPMTTKHHTVRSPYATKPMLTEQLQKAKTQK